MGTVDKLFVGKDGILRSVRIKTAKKFFDRPAQVQKPLELQDDYTTNNPDNMETEKGMREDNVNEEGNQIQAAQFFNQKEQQQLLSH